MPADVDAIVAALRLPPGTRVELEPLGDVAGAPIRAAICPPGGSERLVLLREDAEPEAAQNHIAVMEALTNARFPFAPKLLGVAGLAAVEEWAEGATALALVPPAGSAEAAMAALAALHSLPLREGLDFEKAPAALLPGDDVPLHRLGFAASEREPAREPFAAARAALLATPFGFAHRDATAAHVLLTPGGATLLNFARAGLGPQLFDVAAFLLTSGLEAPARRALAARYAEVRGFSPETADFTDLAGIIWGVQELLGLPRRQILAFGDDAAMTGLHLAATRIERGIRAPAGEHPAAAAIRAALWPA